MLHRLRRHRPSCNAIFLSGKGSFYYVLYAFRDAACPCSSDPHVCALASLQIATLRTIGSQTHPAVHQMILSHDTQLGQVQQQLAQVRGVLASC